MKLAKAVIKTLQGAYTTTPLFFCDIESVQKNIGSATLIQWPLKVNGIEQWVEVDELKPDPCIFCGGEVVILGGEYGGFFVACTDTKTCGYLGPRRNAKSEAIEAHNEMARKVRG